MINSSLFEHAEKKSNRKMKRRSGSFCKNQTVKSHYGLTVLEVSIKIIELITSLGRKKTLLNTIIKSFSGIDRPPARRTIRVVPVFMWSRPLQGHEEYRIRRTITHTFHGIYEKQLVDLL